MFTIIIVYNILMIYYSIYFIIYQLVVTFLVPSIIMIICYSSVIKSLWKSTQNMAGLTNRFVPKFRPLHLTLIMLPKITRKS